MSCTFCPRGKRGTMSRTECDDCRVGRYASEPGSAYCPKCDVGRYQPSTGSIGCIACPAGTTSGLGATECV